MKYKECPRCNSNWKTKEELHDYKYQKDVELNQYTECGSCGMTYGIPNTMVLRNFLGKQGYHLGWFLWKNDCYYGCLEDVVSLGLDETSNSPHLLPFLPFTITPQELTDLLAKGAHEPR